MLVIPLLMSPAGCFRPDREDLDYSYAIEQTLSLEDIGSVPMVQFESVHWDGDDQAELQSLIVDDNLVSGRGVLLLGVGPGLIAILCHQHGGLDVVATDSNRAAVANAKYNIAALKLDDQIDVRAVDEAECFSGTKPTERFDVIIVATEIESQWHAGESTSLSESQSGGADSDIAGGDRVDSFLRQLPDHLKPGGRCIVACHQSEHIDRWLASAAVRGYRAEVMGERPWQSNPGDQYPAVLLDIHIPADRFDAK